MFPYPLGKKKFRRVPSFFKEKEGTKWEKGWRNKFQYFRPHGDLTDLAGQQYQDLKNENFSFLHLRVATFRISVQLASCHGRILPD